MNDNYTSRGWAGRLATVALILIVATLATIAPGLAGGVSTASADTFSLMQHNYTAEAAYANGVAGTHPVGGDGLDGGTLYGEMLDNADLNIFDRSDLSTPIQTISTFIPNVAGFSETPDGSVTSDGSTLYFFNEDFSSVTPVSSGLTGIKNVDYDFRRGVLDIIMK